MDPRTVPAGPVVDHEVRFGMPVESNYRRHRHAPLLQSTTWMEAMYGKRPRKKRSQLRFKPTPEIIGEGGQDADLPPKAVSKWNSAPLAIRASEPSRIPPPEIVLSASPTHRAGKSSRTVSVPTAKYETRHLPVPPAGYISIPRQAIPAVPAILIPQLFPVPPAIDFSKSWHIQPGESIPNVLPTPPAKDMSIPTSAQPAEKIFTALPAQVADKYSKTFPPPLIEDHSKSRTTHLVKKALTTLPAGLSDKYLKPLPPPLAENDSSPDTISSTEKVSKPTPAQLAEKSSIAWPVPPSTIVRKPVPIRKAGNTSKPLPAPPAEQIYEPVSPLPTERGASFPCIDFGPIGPRTALGSHPLSEAERKHENSLSEGWRIWREKNTEITVQHSSRPRTPMNTPQGGASGIVAP